MIRHYLFPVVGIILGFSACRSSETNEKQVLMVKTETVKNYENELQVTYPGRVKAAADVRYPTFVPIRQGEPYSPTRP